MRGDPAVGFRNQALSLYKTRLADSNVPAGCPRCQAPQSGFIVPPCPSCGQQCSGGVSPLPSSAIGLYRSTLPLLRTATFRRGVPAAKLRNRAVSLYPTALADNFLITNVISSVSREIYSLFPRLIDRFLHAPPPETGGGLVEMTNKAYCRA